MTSEQTKFKMLSIIWATVLVVNLVFLADRIYILVYEGTLEIFNFILNLVIIPITLYVFFKFYRMYQQLSWRNIWN